MVSNNGLKAASQPRRCFGGMGLKLCRGMAAAGDTDVDVKVSG